MPRTKLTKDIEWVVEAVDANEDIIDPLHHDDEASAMITAKREVQAEGVAYVDVARRVRLWREDGEMEDQTYAYTVRLRVKDGAIVATKLLTPDGLSPVEFQFSPTTIIERIA